MVPSRERHSSTPSPDPPRGRVVVVSGPSGVGKSSVVDGLAERHPFHFSVSMTTRDPRPGERAGEDYHFVDRERFEQAVSDGLLAEWASYGGELYGTPKVELERGLAAGQDVLLDIEIRGAQQIAEAYPEALMIFIEPPSLEVLRERLEGRGDTDEEDTKRRLAVAEWQMSTARGLFQHFVVNDELAAAIDEVAGILAAPNR